MNVLRVIIYDVNIIVCLLFRIGDSLALAAHTANCGVFLLAVMTFEHAAPPPLLDNVLGQEAIDALIIGPILVQPCTEHETVEVCCTVSILVQGTELQTTPRSLPEE